MDASNVITSAENWLSNAFQTVISWIFKTEKAVNPALIIAENILNALKAFNGSVAGQTLESIIELEIPASTGLIYAFFNALPNWLAGLQLLQIDLTQPLTSQWIEVQAKLEQIKTDDPDVYACIMTSLKALFTKFFANNGAIPLNIQQALTIAPASHNLALVTGEPGQ